MQREVLGSRCSIKASMGREDLTDLDVSDHISQFLLHILQFLGGLQRGFLELFLREYTKRISDREAL